MRISEDVFGTPDAKDRIHRADLQGRKRGFGLSVLPEALRPSRCPQAGVDAAGCGRAFRTIVSGPARFLFSSVEGSQRSEAPGHEHRLPLSV